MGLVSDIHGELQLLKFNNILYFKMKKKDFYNELVDYLELEADNLSENTNLKTIEGYDSMAILSVIAFCDEKFGKKFTAQQLNTIVRVKDLMELVGLENFED